MSELSLVSEGFKNARALTRRHAKTFYFASMTLPRQRRAAAYALYAFLRRLDDLVDEPGDPGLVRERLARAGALVAGLKAPLIADAEVRAAGFKCCEYAALRQTVATFGLDLEPFYELIRGLEMDLGAVRYQDFSQLDLYCHRVAGTVGLLMAPILGVAGGGALANAAALGKAMQLTNILRDIAEDYARGRVYLPRAELEAYGVGALDAEHDRPSDGFKALLRFQMRRARAWYAEALLGVPAIKGFFNRWTVKVMAAIYGDILHVIEARDFDVFSARARVGGWRKLWLLAVTLFASPKGVERVLCSARPRRGAEVV